jgi:pyridoxal phosphate enzyme (YggS family)
MSAMLDSFLVAVRRRPGAGRGESAAAAFTVRPPGVILARETRAAIVNEADLHATLRARLDAVEARLRDACRRAGRDRGDVTLVAVTKTVPVEVARALPELGVLDLGENRPQELWRKAEAVPPPVRWHLIGHLQRNKVGRTLPLLHRVHSVDSPRLLHALEEEAARRQVSLPALLEVNVSREPNKHGLTPEEVADLAPAIAALKHVRVDGLMTMAALEEDPERCRPTFAELRTLRDRLGDRLGPGHPLVHLSMGMSNDFEVAVEEGATLVRLGTVLFEGLA